MVGAEAFEHVKANAVFINLGRGPVVDEPALIKALKAGKLKGAALDVFVEEPLPESSELWDLDNVLVSPHNMDQTATVSRIVKRGRACASNGSFVFSRLTLGASPNRPVYARSHRVLFERELASLHLRRGSAQPSGRLAWLLVETIK